MLCPVQVSSLGHELAPALASMLQSLTLADSVVTFVWQWYSQAEQDLRSEWLGNLRGALVGRMRAQ